MKNIQKDNIVIHIGYHKAASSLLQNIFPKLPINYLWIGGNDIRKRELLDYVQRIKNFNPEVFKRLIENNLGLKKYHTTVLSHEELSGHPHGYKIINPFVVADNLNNSFKKVKILIIIRDQIDYLFSLYSFRVAIKGSETRNIDDFILQEFEQGLKEKLQYHKLINYYIKLFGKENVFVIPMELIKKDTDLFFSKIFNILELNYDDYKSVINSRKINKSTRSILLINFWKKCNIIFNWIYRQIKNKLTIESDIRFRYSYYHLKRRTTYLLNPIFSIFPKYDINESTKELLNQKFRESNRLLSNVINVDLKSFNYPN